MAAINPTLNSLFAQLRCCVLIPTYNNEKTIKKVIDDSLIYTDKLIIVNDGSTDSTSDILKLFESTITIITHKVNLGKGMALRNGFNKAIELGYENVITIDSDGQHFPSDFEKFLIASDQNPGALIIGARNMNSENVPGASSFGNKFSNFWYRVETGIQLPDTQSGYRLYPVNKLQHMSFFSTRFEFEIEVIVKAAWKGISVLAIPVQVYYAKPGERVSHFRPTKDFTRISILNTYLVVLTFLWHKPKRIVKNFSPTAIKLFIKKHFFNQEESITKKSLSVSLGIFFGIVPIWGYQLISAIAAAYLLKLNKAIVILTANISIPPLLPFILLASLRAGELVTGQNADLTLSNISLQTIKTNLYTYLTGACLLAVLFSIFMGLLTFVTLSILRRRNSSTH